MLDNMLKFLYCPVCEDGKLFYSNTDTYKLYSDPHMFSLENIDKLVDGIISDVLVFRCNACDYETRMTFKNIEFEVRKNLSRRVIDEIARAQIIQSNTIYGNVLRYCGKCPGFDGKGSCHIKFYEKCKIRRFV